MQSLEEMLSHLGKRVRVTVALKGDLVSGYDEGPRRDEDVTFDGVLRRLVGDGEGTIQTEDGGVLYVWPVLRVERLDPA